MVKHISLARVLVVDDNRDAADMVAMLLAEFGYITATAYDGDEALLVADVFAPDVIFLDINMPKMDGCLAAIELRKHPVNSKAKLIALTAVSDVAGITAVRNAGFDALLRKPASTEDLLFSVS